jgi:hypothetical protein
MKRELLRNEYNLTVLNNCDTWGFIFNITGNYLRRFRILDLIHIITLFIILQ